MRIAVCVVSLAVTLVTPGVLWELGGARRRVSTVVDDTLWRGLAVAPAQEVARRRRNWELDRLTTAGVP